MASGLAPAMPIGARSETKAKVLVVVVI